MTASAPTSATTRADSAPPSRHRVMTDTPVGVLTLVARDDALVGVWMSGQRHRPEPFGFGEPADGDDQLLTGVENQLREYFAGTRTTFDVALEPDGTDFQRRVWQALCDIPYGETWSYGRLAAQLGLPGAARAVGLANGRNPISIVVPCHRVVGADGALTGYGGGLERKRILLDLERGAAQQTLPVSVLDEAPNEATGPARGVR